MRGVTQQVAVRAYSGGGRGGAPYIAVGVGTCLVYAYDQAAIDSHLTAWRDVEQVNRSARVLGTLLVRIQETRERAGKTAASCARHRL